MDWITTGMKFFVAQPGFAVTKSKTHTVRLTAASEKKVVSLSWPPPDLRVTPELEATVTGISPNETQDEKSGQSFFKAKIAIKPTELVKLGKKRLTPGLPAEVFIQGKKRRVLRTSFSRLSTRWRSRSARSNTRLEQDKKTAR